MNIGDRVQTINTLCPISGTIVEIWDNLIVISDDDAETDDDRLEFHVSDLEVLMKFNVTDIEFDFDDGNCNEEEYKLTFDEEIEIRDLALGVWEADDEDDMIDEITTATGYLIKNIYYDIQLK